MKKAKVQKIANSIGRSWIGHYKTFIKKEKGSKDKYLYITSIIDEKTGKVHLVEQGTIDAKTGNAGGVNLDNEVVEFGHKILKRENK